MLIKKSNSAADSDKNAGANVDREGVERSFGSINTQDRGT